MIAKTQKIVLKNPLSASLTLWLLQSIPIFIGYGLYIFYLIEYDFNHLFWVDSLRELLFPEAGADLFNFLTLLLILWVGIRNFIFRLEIKEEGLWYRTEIGLSGLIPWQLVIHLSYISLIQVTRTRIFWSTPVRLLVITMTPFYLR